MKISARNSFTGTIQSIEAGPSTTTVVIKSGDALITSTITSAAAQSLGLTVGGSATAVIKSTDVLLMVD
jgi:molybdate transport system regulatory protein